MNQEIPQNKLEKQELDIHQESFEKLVSRFSDAIKDADVLEKEILTSDNFLLVAGGIKPATDLDISKELLSQLEQAEIIHGELVKDLRNRFMMLGLFLSKEETIDDQAIHFYIYNPKLLALRSLANPELIPFSEKDDLIEWIEKNRDTGVDRDLILGYLYGYPLSSIKSYIAYKRHTKILHKLKKIGTALGRVLAERKLKALRQEEEKMHTIRSFGELYLTSDPNMPDVAGHEQNKKEFFDKLKQNKAVWVAIESIRQELKRLVEHKD